MDKEKLLTLIGELISEELEDLNRLEYNVKNSQTSFTVIMENGKKFIVSVTELQGHINK